MPTSWSLAALSTVGWLRFEVVRRRDVTLPGGQRWSWIHCRALTDQGPGVSPLPLPAEEWMFAGVDLPTWHTLAERFRTAGVKFVIEPYVRFAGEPGEQATMFFLDPSGNALEFKAFADPSRLFAK